MEWINRYIFGTAVPVLLICAGIFFGFRLRWFYLFHPIKTACALVERRQTGRVSPFRALTLSLAGTLGVGNIVGVSAAISMGGFGAVFWMWISALCAMLLKYAEIVLAMRHRRFDGAGKPHGAAMYYIRDCFFRLGARGLGTGIAALFAILCMLNAVTMGSVVQVSAITDAMEGVFSISPLVTGGILTLACWLVIRKGTGGMIALTERLVPLMTLGYLVLSCAVLILRADRLPTALAAILSHAFTSDAAIGGVGGFLLSAGVRFGTMRGLLSNEAGCGTAPAAHAVSDCQSPARQGVFGIFEVFTDTILLCTVTALVVIVSWQDVVARDGEFMMMTITAYSSVLGRSAAIFMGLAVLFFGFATVICWAHYGIESASYLSEKPIARKGFVLMYASSVFGGAFASSELIWQCADFAIGAMTLINVTVLCLMNREVKEETDRWLGK